MSKEKETKTKPKKDNKLESLQSKIEKLEGQNSEYYDKLLRFKAEFENYKKRMIKEQSLAVKYAAESIIHRILPIVDDLDRALIAISDSQDPAKIIEGVRLTHQDIKKLLDEHLVHEIDPHGKPFDPEEHEAMMTVDSSDHEDNHVVEVLQKGYKLDGKVVRPARVSICKKND